MGAWESDEYEALGCDAADERGGGDNDGDVEVQHGGFGGGKDHAVGRDEYADGEDRVCGQLEFVGESFDICISHDTD